MPAGGSALLLLELPEEVWGVLICLAGSTFTAFGLVLQKLSHEKNARNPYPVIFFKQPWWLLGFAIFMASQILNLVAMGMAPQVVLSSIGAWCLIFNALFASWLLGEHLSTPERIAMLGAVLGVLFVIAGTPSSDELFRGNLQAMIEAFTSQSFLASSGAVFVALLGLFGLALFSPVLWPVAWATTAAVLSGFTVMLFKCVSLLVLAPTPRRPGPWVHWEAFVVVAASGLVGVAQLHSMNVGLRTGEALVVVPVYYALGILAQIMTGALVFKELGGFTSHRQVLFFWGGTAFLILCIVQLTRSKISAESNIELDAEAVGEGLDEMGLRKLTTASSQGVAGLRQPLRRTSSADSSMVSVRSSSFDPEAYPESFGEEPRLYMVSVAGPMGIA